MWGPEYDGKQGKRVIKEIQVREALVLKLEDKGGIQRSLWAEMRVEGRGMHCLEGVPELRKGSWRGRVGAY